MASSISYYPDNNISESAVIHHIYCYIKNNYTTHL
jgi:hypothetical protein